MNPNWNASEGNRWIVLFGLGMGKVFRLGNLSMNMNAQMYYNAAKPDGVGNWASRVQLQFIFPK